LRKGLIENPGNGVITTLFKKGLTANFFKKSLIKSSVTFGFESLIPQTLSGVITTLFKKGLTENSCLI
jgi:hypothetical protein